MIAELSTVSCEPSQVNCSSEICKHWNTSVVPRVTKEY